MFRTTFACLIFSALAFSQAKAPVAVVSSRAAITIEGVNAPVTGGVAWPVAAGDVIQTSSAPAEIRLTDGTKIFLPAGSKFIVPAPAPQADVAVHRAVDARTSAYTSVPTSAIPRIAPAGNKLSHGILNILDGGIVEPPSVLSPLALAQSRPLASGSTPPGDIIVADRDGVAVVPLEDADEVAQLAIAHVHREEQRLKEIDRGVLVKPEIDESLRISKVIP